MQQRLFDGRKVQGVTLLRQTGAPRSSPPELPVLSPRQRTARATVTFKGEYASIRAFLDVREQIAFCVFSG